MADLTEMYVQATVDRDADPRVTHRVTGELLDRLRADAAAAGLRLVGDTVAVSLHHPDGDDALTGRTVIVRVTAPVEPIPEETPPCSPAAP